MTGELLRRHLRSGGAGVGVLLAVVTSLAAFALVGGDRLTNAAVDRALGAQLRSVSPSQTDVLVVRPRLASIYRATRSGGSGPASADPFSGVEQATLQVLGPTFRALLASSTHRAASTERTVSLLNGSGRSLRVNVPQVNLVIQSGLDERVTWSSGRPPRATTETAVVTRVGTPGQRVRVPVFQVALSAGTADLWGVRVGDRLRLGAVGSAPDDGRSPVIEVSGIYAAVDSHDPFWGRDAQLLHPAAVPGDFGAVRRADALVAGGDYARLSGALTPEALGGPVSPGALPPGSASPSLELSWDFRLDTARIRAEDIDPILNGLGRLDTAGAQLVPSYPYPRATSGLPQVFGEYQRDVAVTSSILAIVHAGTALLSLLVLALTAQVLAERRRPAMRLLRSRGGSGRQLSWLAAAEVLVWVVPGAALGIGLGRLVPGWSATWPWVGVALAVLVPTAVAAGATWSGVRVLVGRDRSEVAGGAGAVRITTEVLVVALAGFALITARQRAPEVASGAIDPYVALTPALLAVAVGVVVIRVLPLPVRWAARLAARGRGALGFLGMARSARERSVALVPVVALLLATSLATLVVTLTTSASDQRTLTAWRAVGADARVDAQRLDATDLEGLAALPGVTEVLPAYRDPRASLVGAPDAGNKLVTLIAVDPQRYAAMLAGTPLAFDPSALQTTSDPGGPLPALVSGHHAAMDADTRVLTSRRSIPIRVVGQVPALRRGGTTSELVVLVSRDALDAVDTSLGTTTAFVDLAPGAALSPTDVPGALVTDVTNRVAWEADVGARPLNVLTRQVFTASALLAAIDSALAVLLLLTLTAPGRRQALVRLRTMGLPRGQERRLVVYEVLPLVLAALISGIALGLSLPTLIHGILDLAGFTGGTAYPPIEADPSWTLALAASVGVVTGLALAVDAIRARRSAIARHLRQGDLA